MLLSASKILGQVFGLGFTLFTFWFALSSSLLGPIPGESPTTLVLAIAACIALHELLHAVSAFCVGARRVSIGAWRKRGILLGFYVKIDDELPVSRWLIVALTPLLLSPASLLLAAIVTVLRGFLLWLSIVNAAGSAGDVALAILAAGAGSRAVVKDFGDAIEVKGGSPSRGSWALLKALATLGYVLFGSFVASQVLLTVAAARGQSIELHGIKLVEVARKGSSVAATVTSNLLLLSLLASSAAAAIVALCSWRREQPTYMAASHKIP